VSLGVAALGGCGDGGGGAGGGGPLTDADVAALADAKSKFLNYCGERKANGADETQPVPPPISDAVSDVIEILEGHPGESFELEGEKLTVRAFVDEQVETLENCSDQQVARIQTALGEL
jgi:hypothetical protein